MAEGKKIREPAVAGQFYDGSPERLKRSVEKMLSSPATMPGIPRDHFVQAVIVPHAGYIFSGAAAAHTFSCAKSGKYRKAVIIAPSHTAYFAGLATSSFDTYRTPLGDVAVDMAAVKSLESLKSPFIKDFTRAHIPEHSLEVQLPFLQTLFPGLEIVPLICGQTDEKILAALAEALLPLLNSENLWVISSDFTHFGRPFGYMPFPEESAPEKLEELDLGAVETILEVSSESFSAYLEKTGATICGANPIRVLLKTIEASPDYKDNFKPLLVEYTTSGKITGDYSHCVSYAGIAVCRKHPGAAGLSQRAAV